MPTGYEVKAYSDFTRIANALSEISTTLAEMMQMTNASVWRRGRRAAAKLARQDAHFEGEETKGQRISAGLKRAHAHRRRSEAAKLTWARRKARQAKAKSV